MTQTFPLHYVIAGGTTLSKNNTHTHYHLPADVCVRTLHRGGVRAKLHCDLLIHKRTAERLLHASLPTVTKLLSVCVFFTAFFS